MRLSDFANCASCEFFCDDFVGGFEHPSSSRRIGQCRRHAPIPASVVVTVQDGKHNMENLVWGASCHAIWPVVCEDFFCGEYVDADAETARK
jgi:hypothetical protein